MVDQCCFPILRNFRSFEVKGNENFHNFDFEQVCPPWLLENGIAAAPELAILRIHQLLIEHSLSYHQFTHLDVQWDKDPDHLLHVLGLCAELQVLQVRCFYGREEPPQVTPITLSALQSLHIGVSHSAFAQIQILFGSLTLPSLHSLELRFHMGDAPPNNRPIMARGIELGFPALLNMLIHSSDKLKKLSLVFFFYIPHDDIFEVLKSCPSLDTLELQCIPSHRHSQYHIQFVSFLIQRLILGVHPWSAHSWGTRNPPLLPKLRNLLIHMKSPATSPPEEMIRCILDMVESRSRSMNAISTDADPKTSLLQNVSISFRDIKEHCWKDSKDCRSLLHCSTLLDRLATLEEHGTKCMIEWSTQRGTASPRLPMYTDADSDELDEEDSD
ncbi:hypothetical protein MPER_12509 [Moniliophthora perniciosa FA553]|nr:hypothetical protein MPER_12509 [Moniliophthora perniciosa FA553]